MEKEENIKTENNISEQKNDNKDVKSSDKNSKKLEKKNLKK